jgi:hypothetical protein
MKKHVKIRRFWRTYRALIWLVIACGIIGLCNGCVKNTAANDYCFLYRPIRADYKNDTTQTLQQVDENNIVFDTICE